MEDNKNKNQANQPGNEKPQPADTTTPSGHENLSNNSPRPFYSQRLFVAGASIFTLCLTSVVLYYVFFNKKDNRNPQKPTTSSISAPIVRPGDEAFIHPPMPKLEMPYSQYAVNVATGRDILHVTGSHIVVPPFAFSDINGVKLTGIVNIKYREFHSIMDCFMSGIPMSYDSAGKKYDFQTAGMFDIQAYQDNKPVLLAPGKNIKVDMPSSEKGNYFNMYKLDSIHRNWTYLGPDTSRLRVAKQQEQVAVNVVPNPAWDIDLRYWDNPCEVPMLDTLKDDYTHHMKVNVPAKPAQPTGEASSIFSIVNVRYSRTKFPELAYYYDAYFEPSGARKSDCGLGPNEMMEKKAVLKKDPQTGSYFLHARIKHTGSVSTGCDLPVKLVFKKKDYDRAFDTYIRALNTYDSVINNNNLAENEQAQHEKMIRARNQEYKKRWDAAMADCKRINKEARERYDKYVSSLTPEQLAIFKNQKKMDSLRREKAKVAVNYMNMRREFAISSFGIYNSDCPHHFTNPVSIDISLRDKDGKVYNFDQTYLIDKTSKFVHTFYNIRSGEKLMLTPGHRNLLFGILPDGKIAMVAEKDMEKIASQNKAELTLNFPTKTFKTAEEVKNFVLGKEEGD